MTDLLLHICCAPCSTVAGEALSAQGLEWKGLFHNPNIHPVTEFRLRRDCLAQFAARKGWNVEIDDSYPLEEIIDGMRNTTPRCSFCHGIRLQRTAQLAAEQGIPLFTTTLCVSPYQDHDLIKSSGRAAAEKFGVEFLYRDFRPLYPESVRISRAEGLYRQKYCGCIFSEANRFLKRKPAARKGDGSS